MRDAPTTIGNYVLCGELARGGMATIFIGHALGSARPLAIKTMSTQGSSLEMITMFLDELALAAASAIGISWRQSRCSVPTTTSVLVMEYVEGETVGKLIRACREQEIPMPVPIAVGIVHSALHGLNAVHEATDAAGTPLGIVHRDVSPQNIMVGIDGVTRLVDFGVAKATVRLQQDADRALKGKLAYMAPEQLDRHEASRLTDLYSMAIVLWEALTGRRLFEAETEGQLVASRGARHVEPGKLAPARARAGARCRLAARARA